MDTLDLGSNSPTSSLLINFLSYMLGGPCFSLLLEEKTRPDKLLGPLLAPCLGHFEEVMLFSESWLGIDSFLGNEYLGDFRDRTPTISVCPHLQCEGYSVYTYSS